MLICISAIIWRYIGLSYQPLWLRSEELRASLRHHDRVVAHRQEVDSQASKAIRMMALVSAPGKYVGLGNKVIQERRSLPRTRNY